MAIDRRKTNELRKRLEELLKIAEATFPDPKDPNPTFDEQLLEIPALVLALMPSIERSGQARVPLWRCIEALDKSKLKIRVITSLDQMVDNASKLPAGPFVKLVTDYRLGLLNRSYEQRLIDLSRYIYRAGESLDGYAVKDTVRWQPLPSDLTQFAPLLRHTISASCKAMIGDYDSSADAESIKKWAYVAFLNLVWQVHEWNNRYFKAVSPFCKLLTFLHNPKYDEVAARLAYAPGKRVNEYVKLFRKDEDAERKRDARAQAGAKPRRFKTSRDEKDKTRKYLEGTLV